MLIMERPVITVTEASAHGVLSLAVWRNGGVTIKKSYKDKNGQWKCSGQLFKSELGVLMGLIVRALASEQTVTEKTEKEDPNPLDEIKWG